MSFSRIDHSPIYRAFCIARLRKIEDYVRAHLAERISIEMLAEYSPKRETNIHLNRLFRSAQAFTVEPRPVEAEDAPLPGSLASSRHF